MTPLTLTARAAHFNHTYAKWPASHLHVVQEQHRDVIYGRWLIGNDYRNKSKYYGAYPAGYLPRVMALFPDITETVDILHVFSGSLPSGNYHRLDVRADMDPEYVGSVYDAPTLVGGYLGDWQLILADPPYSSADAAHYGTPMINRRVATNALACVAAPGGFLVWLDTCWPQHRKDLWVTVGRITLLRSTNHRVREVTIFQRTSVEVGAGHRRECAALAAQAT